MNISFSLKHLRYFIALADELHFGRAAEVCNITQPSLSAAIKELEDLLGVTLLERTKRSVVVTPIGERVLAMARSTVQNAEEIASFCEGYRAPLSGDLAVGVIPTIGPYLLPSLLPELRGAFPKLRLFLHEAQSADLVEKLRIGKLDLLILALPYVTESAEAVPFMIDRFQAAMPDDHPLAQKQALDFSDLQNETLLLLEEGHCLRDHALDACHLTSASKGREFSATSLATLVQMVAGGLGMTLLPQMAIDQRLAEDNDLVVRPFKSGDPARKIGLVWRKSSGRKEEYLLLANHLQKRFCYPKEV